MQKSEGKKCMVYYQPELDHVLKKKVN